MITEKALKKIGTKQILVKLGEDISFTLFPQIGKIRVTVVLRGKSTVTFSPSMTREELEKAIALTTFSPAILRLILKKIQLTIRLDKLGCRASLDELDMQILALEEDKMNKLFGIAEEETKTEEKKK